MMWSAAKALLARDMRLLWRRRGDALQPAMFALLVVVLFALALGGEPQSLSKVAQRVTLPPMPCMYELVVNGTRHCWFACAMSCAGVWPPTVTSVLRSVLRALSLVRW